LTVIDGVLLIYRLQVHANIPSINACIALNEDLTTTVSLDGKLVPASQFQDLCKVSMQRMSALVNLMARVKCWAEDKVSRPTKLNTQMAVDCLQSALETVDDSDSDEHRQVSFIIEQLKLLSKQKHGRHYSPQLTIMSYRIFASSSAAYHVLLEENVLCLPFKTTLQKVTRRLDSASGLDNSAYLKLRVSKLNEYDRNVIQIFQLCCEKSCERTDCSS
jgi:hypothetical protein